MTFRNALIATLAICLIGGCAPDTPNDPAASASPGVNGPGRGPRVGRGPRLGPVPLPSAEDHDLKGIGNNMHEQVSPGEMTARVKNALASTKDLDVSKVSVSTDAQKIIHLTGTAKNEHEKAEAGKIAEAIAGRTYRVSNELRAL